ncbi:hypothetical protein TNIN_96631 [Trichonephila inaurata madagascariensis]|uniref:Uncharacterized protein n=1 Tax=Trichonephila inaurata madagascariensis TaxID=2747483 RepID=A0A8X6YLG2_9ARAC|nr:hypothetical protein TNIN_96631 [Trichonephila inaurata madagascariensis]
MLSNQSLEMSLLKITLLLILMQTTCFAATFPPPRRDIVPPPYQPVDVNTLHALYFDATRQAYVFHAFAVMDVMRAEWKKALQKLIMMPFTHG